MKEKQGYDKKITRRKAALALLDEMIADCAVYLSQDAQRLYKPRLKAVRKAIAKRRV